MRSVEKGSRAERAGFHAGDVIVKINGEPVGDSAISAMRCVPAKRTRHGRHHPRQEEQTLTLTLPERKQSDLKEESFEIPEIDAEAQVQFDEAGDELARVQPQIALRSPRPISMRQESGNHFATSRK